jgi:solute carrier family 25 citrate transporter 1
MSSAPAKEDVHPAIKGPSALRSILAGATAGAVEIGERSSKSAPAQSLTQSRDSNHIPRRMYVDCLSKTDFSLGTDVLTCAAVAKTRTQLNRRLAAGQKLPWPPFGKQWYAGCTTLIIGNSAKAGIRTCSRG